MAMGMQDKFSWSQVGTSALSSGLSAGVGSVVQSSEMSSALSNTFGAAAPYAQVAVSNAAMQGVAMVTGQQKSFSWSAIAASEMIAAFGRSGWGDDLRQNMQSMTDGMGISKDLSQTLAGMPGNFLQSAATNFASGERGRAAWGRAFLQSGARAVGDYGSQQSEGSWGEGGYKRMLAHMAVGAVGAEWQGRDAMAAAVGAGVASEAVPWLDESLGMDDGARQQILPQLSRIAGAAAAQAFGGDVFTAGDAGQNVTENNFLFHNDRVIRARLEAGVKAGRFSGNELEQVQAVIASLNREDKENDSLLIAGLKSKDFATRQAAFELLDSIRNDTLKESGDVARILNPSVVIRMKESNGMALAALQALQADDGVQSARLSRIASQYQSGRPTAMELVGHTLRPYISIPVYDNVIDFKQAVGDGRWGAAALYGGLAVLDGVTLGGDSLVEGLTKGGFRLAARELELRAAERVVPNSGLSLPVQEVVGPYSRIRTDGMPSRLYHYTDEAGMVGIVDSQAMNPSLKAVNPNDVRYGNGQYFSDITPGGKTPAQLSRAFINNPFQGKRFSNYVEIDTVDLNVLKGRDGVYVIPNETPLDLRGRITGNGRVN